MNIFSRRQFIEKSFCLAGITFFPFDILPDLRKQDFLPDIAVVTTTPPSRAVRKAIELIGGMSRFVSRGDIVVVKPNISWNRKPHLAATTNPEVVATVVKMCFEAGAKKVKVFDRTCNNSVMCYKNSQIASSAAEAGADVIYIEKSGFSEVRFHDSAILKSWQIYKPALEADVFINLPIAKHHSLTGVTLGIKNLMGILGGDRGKFHSNIELKLPDLAKLIKPALTIIDAIRILTRNGPTGGNIDDVKTLNTIIAGTKIATVDAYATTLFGLDPLNQKFLLRASELGLGEINLRNVRISKLNI